MTKEEHQRQWYYEGNVQAALVRHLVAEGWRLLHQADPKKRGDKGPDLIVDKEAEDRVLLTENKGWPRGTDLTRPTTQAGHYFSDVLAQLMVRRAESPRAELAACFPDFPRYRRLTQVVRESLETLRFGVYFVGADGRVTCWLPHPRQASSQG